MEDLKITDVYDGDFVIFERFERIRMMARDVDSSEEVVVLISPDDARRLRDWLTAFLDSQSPADLSPGHTGTPED